MKSLNIKSISLRSILLALDYFFVLCWAIMLFEQCWDMVMNVLVVDRQRAVELLCIPVFLGAVVWRVCLCVMMKADDRRGFWVSMSFMVFEVFCFLYSSIVPTYLVCHSEPSMYLFQWVNRLLGLKFSDLGMNVVRVTVWVWLWLVPVAYFIIRKISGKLEQKRSSKGMFEKTLYFYGVVILIFFVMHLLK